VKSDVRAYDILIAWTSSADIRDAGNYSSAELYDNVNMSDKDTL